MPFFQKRVISKSEYDLKGVKIRKRKQNTILEVRLKKHQKVEPREYAILAQRKCPSLLRVAADGNRLLYDISHLESLESEMKQPICGARFLEIVSEILSAIDEIQGVYLQYYKVLLDPSTIFCKPTTRQLCFVYCPVMNCTQRIGLLEFFTDLISLAKPARLEDQGIISRMQSLTEGMVTLSLYELEQFVAKEEAILHPGGSNSEPAIKSAIPFEGPNSSSVRFRISLRSCDGTLLFNICSEEYFIGRKLDVVDGVIPHNTTVGRIHCRIAFEHGSYMIYDLKTRNGTFVNGKRLAPNTGVKISRGDRVQLANMAFVVE